MSQNQVFSVFLPNKSRYKLEISKVSPLYQGLEKVCTEKGYLPAHQYVFRYNKIYPDLSAPVGMLKLSNLTELELVPASEAPVKNPTAGPAANSGTVSVGLQYGSQRHVDSWPCDTSLWDMICRFSDKHAGWIPATPPQADQHPVLVHTRLEVPGEAALRHTSLRQLGLLPGGPPALLRLLHRPVPPDRLLAAGQQAEARWRQQASETEPAAVKDTAAGASSADPSATAATFASTHVSAPAQAPPPPHTASGATAACSSSDANLFSPFRQLPGPDDDDAEERRQRKRQAAREPRTLAEALNMPDFDSQQQQALQQAQFAFAVAVPPVAFGPDRPFRFPAETAGQDLYRNELAEVRPADFAPCDRRLSAYVAGGGASEATAGVEAHTAASTELEEPDDSFFNVTESDLRKMMADLKQKVEAETNGPLLTRHQRQQRREDLYAAYEYTVVRLFFPDRRVVQAAFRPRETVHALLRFVRDSLLSAEAQGAAADCYLYTTPPKTEISDTAQFLIHADLVPMPIVHVGFRSPLPEGVAILKPEILALVGSREDCDRIALACMKSAVEPIYARQQSQQQQQQRSAGSTAAAAAAGPGAQRAANMVPKWFKK